MKVIKSFDFYYIYWVDFSNCLLVVGRNRQQQQQQNAWTKNMKMEIVFGLSISHFSSFHTASAAILFLYFFFIFFFVPHLFFYSQFFVWVFQMRYATGLEMAKSEANRNEWMLRVGWTQFLIYYSNKVKYFFK